MSFFFFLDNIIYMASNNTPNINSQVEDVLNATQKALDLQAEADLKTPKTIDGIVEKANEQNKDPEALSGSPQGESEKSGDVPKTPQELYQKLSQLPESPADSTDNEAAQKQYISLADVPVVPPTNVAAACLSGVEEPLDLQKSNVVNAHDSSGATLTPGHSHLNPIHGKGNVIETPGYTPRLPGSTRLNPVKVAGNPPSVIDCPYDSSMHYKNSNVQSVNVPGAGLSVPIVTTSIASVNVPPLSGNNNQQVLVNIPGSHNIPPGPTSVARTGTNAHMNPVKLAGAPLVIQTPVTTNPGVYLNIAEIPQSAIKSGESGVDIVEHFTNDFPQSDLIECFQNGPDIDASDKSNVDSEHSDESSTPNVDSAEPEDESSTIVSKDANENSKNAVSIQQSEKIIDTTDKSANETYNELSNVQIPQKKTETAIEDGKTVYDKLSNIPKPFVTHSYVNTPQIRDVHLNPVKNPGTPPNVLETITPQITTPVMSHTNKPTNSVCTPPGQYKARAATGNVHLNPVKTPIPNVIHTPDNISAHVLGSTPVNSVNVPGQSVTIPLQIQNNTQSVNVPPLEENSQNVNGSGVQSHNVPGVPIINS